MTAAVLFLLLAAAAGLVMTVVWFAVVKGATSGWVDAVWSFLVGATGITAALVPVIGWEGDWQRRLLIAAAAGFWSCRLGVHILRRTLQGGEDPRYARLREEWGESWRLRLFLFLQIQAAAALLLIATIFIAARNPAVGLQWSDVAGIAILAMAVIGEGVADAQLSRFRGKTANKGKVCDQGLWSRSRHPNYFFQWLGWCGYAVIAVGPVGDWGWGWLALAGPAFMYWLLVHVSGIPPLEAHMMRSRGAAFAAYVTRVNAFWPGLKKREKTS
jgi:steroid 5-alpha reductase family enzyme